MTIRGDLAPVSSIADDLRGELLADMLDSAAFAVKRRGLTVADTVTGGDRRLSRFGGSVKSRGRTRMGINYTTSGRSTVVNLKPAAMWALTTGGARPHLIGAGRRTRRGRYTRRRSVAVLVFGTAQPSARGRKASRARTGPVRHPGARGRGALARVYADVPKIVADTFADALTDRTSRRGR
jgi:hypothetical protein